MKINSSDPKDPLQTISFSFLKSTNIDKHYGSTRGKSCFNIFSQMDFPMYKYRFHIGHMDLQQKCLVTGLHCLTTMSKWSNRGRSYGLKTVSGHHPLYCSCKRVEDDKDVKNYLEKVFNKHKIDLYLAGHEHDLQHIKPKDANTSRNIRCMIRDRWDMSFR